MGTSNAYLVDGSDSTLLIDTGNKGNIRYLEATLKHEGLGIFDIDIIILTHAHYDHVGCLAGIKEKSGAKVLVQRDEANFLVDGCTPFPKGITRFSKFYPGHGKPFSSEKFEGYLRRMRMYNIKVNGLIFWTL